MIKIKERLCILMGGQTNQGILHGLYIVHDLRQQISNPIAYLKGVKETCIPMCNKIDSCKGRVVDQLQLELNRYRQC